MLPSPVQHQQESSISPNSPGLTVVVLGESIFPSSETGDVDLVVVNVSGDTREEGVEVEVDDNDEAVVFGVGGDAHSTSWVHSVIQDSS